MHRFGPSRIQTVADLIRSRMRPNVISGEAEPIHFLLGGIVVDGTVLPDLGIFVFNDGIELDYRMGEEWRPPVLTAFFRLLLNLASMDRNSSLPLDGEPPVVAAKFQRCWQRFIAEQGARPT